MATLQICYRKEMNEKTVRLSYLRITCIPGIDSNKWNRKRFQKYNTKIYVISTFEGWKALNTKKKFVKLLKLTIPWFLTNFGNKERIILASWPKRKPDRYKGGNLADCKLLSYIWFQNSSGTMFTNFWWQKKWTRSIIYCSIRFDFAANNSGWNYKDL